MAPLPPGSTIGILGGGQLGRMLALAAARLGLACHIYAPPGDNPAFAVAAAHTEAAWDDLAALDRFAAAVDVVTYEFENVPVAAADHLEALVPVAPGAGVLRVSQDRVAEKSFVSGLSIPVADFMPVDDRTGLRPAVAAIGLPAILKTRRLGYDGKGQTLIGPGDDLDAAWARIGQPAILEAVVPFACEISVIAARGRAGEVVSFDIPENRHAGGILRSSTVPAAIAPATAAAARAIARRLLEALDYVGVIGVEMFLVRRDGRESLAVNEIAPRVHNSGHWTEAATHVSQFEQHVRAVAGWPLVEPLRHHDCVMNNLIGDDCRDWAALAAEPASVLHLYGKAEIRPGRKMGHVTRLKARSAP